MCFFPSGFCEFLCQTWHSDFSEALPDASWLHFCLDGPGKLISPSQVWRSHRWHGKYDVHSSSNWILCQHDDGGVPSTENMKNNMEDVQQRNLDFQ